MQKFEQVNVEMRRERSCGIRDRRRARGHADALVTLERLLQRALNGFTGEPSRNRLLPLACAHVI
jgi:hypothetical protein